MKKTVLIDNSVNPLEVELKTFINHINQFYRTDNKYS